MKSNDILDFIIAMLHSIIKSLQQKLKIYTEE